jgi:hypothetical protein
MIHNLEKNEQIGFKYSKNGQDKHPNTIAIFVGNRVKQLKNEFSAKTRSYQDNMDVFYGTVEMALIRFGKEFFKKRIVIVKI